jgi:ribosomal protein S18 acetylase RimI-like enzyme
MGLDLKHPFRRARRDDASHLAELVNIAGEGLAAYLWARMAGPGETLWDVGRRRAAREEGSFSYRNAVVIDGQDTVVGCLIGYPQPSTPEPIDAGIPPMFVPLQELENLAPDTWYVNVLAVYPQHRGEGWGTRLLGIADELSAAEGKTGLSVIVAGNNTGARRLYERCGYGELARRTMVKEGWQSPGREWVLLVKPRR